MYKKEIKNARIYKEADGRYYIDLRYTEEDDRKITETHIPKLHIPLESGHINTFNICSFDPGQGRETGADYVFGNHAFRMYEGVSTFRTEDGELELYKNVLFTKKVIEEKVQEMTLSEIEKKLGYKVKIISEKGEAE